MRCIPEMRKESSKYLDAKVVRSVLVRSYACQRFKEVRVNPSIDAMNLRIYLKFIFIVNHKKQATVYIEIIMVRYIVF
jgi:hypothetical protein